MHTYSPTDPDCVDCSPYSRECRERCHRKERTCKICSTVVCGKATYCKECLEKVVDVIRQYNHGLSREVAVLVQFGVYGSENRRIQTIIWNVHTFSNL